MAIVFVHGVPETSAIWDPVRARLEVDSIALSLPGFGTPRPDDFGATKDEYASWLAAELERIPGPIDLVAHDWGGLLTVRVVTTFPHLVRSWVADVPHVLHPDYVWHELALEWTAGSGERMIESESLLDRLNDEFLATSLTEADLSNLRAAQDQTMERCIVDLYRSAMPNIWSDWQGVASGPTAAPGLLVLTGEDFAHGEAGPEGSFAHEMVDRLGAEVEMLEDAGHLWMLEFPETAVRLLRRFWSL